ASVVASSIAVNAITLSNQITDGIIANADLAGSIDATKITNTAAVLTANTFTDAQTIKGSTLTIIAPDTVASSLWVSTSSLISHFSVSTAGYVSIQGVAGLLGNVVKITTGTTSLYTFDSTGTAHALNGWVTGGADYAEWFEKESPIKSGDVVGLDVKTGKVRKYAVGDALVGICSPNPGFTGNAPMGKSDEEMNQTYSLVGLVGQLSVDKEQVSVVDGTVFTIDKKKLGYLLANGKIWIRIH
ncbi:MAG: hypothetical protein HY796_08280, partial [Elusimicrobia bacterium]|nr:hypothetical protein [Elusimicrobiota bacterium]